MHGGGIKERLDEAFERWGLACTVRHGGTETAARAFIQPLTRETGDEPFTATALGAADEHCWRYLGPADTEIAMGDEVACREREYIVRDAAECYAGERIAYRWAVLHEKEKPA